MPTNLVMEIEDSDGDSSTTSVWVEDGQTTTNYTTFAAVWADAIDLIVHGVIRKVTMFLFGDTSVLTGNLIGTASDVEKIGSFEFLTSSGIRVSCNIPTIDELLVGSNPFDVLDQADPEVAAFISAMEDGLTVGGSLIQPCDVGEDDIVSTVFARESFQNSGARR